MKSGGFHVDCMWNLADFMKSLVTAPTLHSSNWRVFAETLAFIILGGFHRWNLGEIHQISWLKSTRFQGEIHWISRVKSPTLHSSNWRVFAETLAFIILGGFHRWYLGEIHQISRVKSTRFQGEIHRISRISWNPPVSWMWAFASWSSIGLSIERPKRTLYLLSHGPEKVQLRFGCGCHEPLLISTKSIGFECYKMSHISCKVHTVR